MSENYSLAEAARKYLTALDSLEGRATSRQIRERTDLDSRQIRYYHDKLAAEGIVELDKDPTLTPQNVAPMTVSSLTAKGEKLVERGKTADGKVEQTTEERLDELATEIEEVTELMEGAFPWMQEVAARIRRVEACLEEHGIDVDEFGDVEEFEQ
jgi:hypothetical protein